MPGTLGELQAHPLDDLVGRRGALADRLQLDEHATGG